MKECNRFNGGVSIILFKQLLNQYSDFFLNIMLKYIPKNRHGYDLMIYYINNSISSPVNFSLLLDYLYIIIAKANKLITKNK